jgi:hypothetical protein
MEGLEQVRQIGDKDLHWCVNIGGSERNLKPKLLSRSRQTYRVADSRGNR